MGEYLKICESHVTKKSKAMNEDALMNSGRKRKLYTELEREYCGGVEISVSPSASRTSSCSKHGESSDVVQMSSRSPDLQNSYLDFDGFETENSMSGGVFSREATPTSELCGDSEQEVMESSSMLKKKPQPSPARPRRRIPAEKMPSEAELEEFFAAAEKCEAKRFAEKYNYDILKDVPLEGRYQWVRLLP